MRTIRSSRAAALAVMPLITLMASSAPPALAAQAAEADLPAVADVPEYRADAARTGVYPGPGPVNEPVILWARDGLGTTTNPVVAGGMVLAGDADGHLYALDVHTGEEVWRFDAKSPMTSLSADDSGVVAAAEAGTVH